MKIKFELTTPERRVFSEEIDQVTLPTRDGEITVLPNHTPIVAVLVPGMATIRKDSNEYYLAVSGGFIEIQPQSRVIVLADTAERAEELDIKKIEEARERAKRLLLEKRQVDDLAFADAAAALERELARLKVARKKYRGGPARIEEHETEQNE